MMKPVVIIGAGQAGSQAAVSLRQFGWKGGIILIGEENYAPYQRPPLSKKFLEGDLPFERLLLKPETYYQTSEIGLRKSVRVEAINPEEKTVSLSNGEVVEFSSAIIATGTTPRRLPDDEIDGAFYLRSVADSLALQDRIVDGAKIVVIGAGYIGLEVAATARKRGASVTVIEAAPRIMARVTGDFISGYIQQYHEKQGVEFRMPHIVNELMSENGKLISCKLDNGDEIDADIAVIGIGVLPCDELAASASIECDNGIKVDENCRTNQPDIYAAGDCTNHYNEHFAVQVRLESVHNAIEQGKTAAAAIVGDEKPYRQAPWFWSDQFDLKIQSVGINAGHDDVFAFEDPEKNAVSAFYFKNEALLAVDAINRPADYLAVRKLLQDKVPISRADIETANGDLKTLLSKKPS
ncbi:MAG: FAD-dependent oxidoreductase [Marinicaulis sp.]|nr:FAD-dependent oxidoreductase [Marinicaulis sp.]NNE40903.1 FAD-dependent oxidoreductase [Marinicaulis sp.]NNL90569.1 FAD-dependent oxidoreductase [Marinicaulis sp.]